MLFLLGEGSIKGQCLLWSESETVQRLFQTQRLLGNTVVEKTQMNLEVEVTSNGIKWKTASVYHFALIIWK